MGHLKRWLKWLTVIVLAVVAFVAFPLVYPAPFFAYGVEFEGLGLYSDQPVSRPDAERLLKNIQTRLNRSSLSTGGRHMQIYVANSKWRRKWLWFVVPKRAGGFVIAPLTRWHAFLSGADIKTGELISPTGYRPHAPRTLAYYGTHELAHTLTHQKLGWLRFLLMPVWIREGVADYVAMPHKSAGSLYAKIGEGKADLAMMKAYGVYAPYRLLVSFFLEEKGWTMEELMNSNLSLREARAIAFRALRHKPI